MKLKIGDTVKVTLGKDRGKTGKIEAVLPKRNSVVVAGANMYKKHVKRQGDKAGQIVELARPLNAAKVALLCPHCHQPTRVGYQGQGKKKIRICKKCGKKSMNRLQEKYFQEIVPVLQKELGLKHALAVPRLKKIVINLGIKEGAGDKGVAKKVADWLSLIAGQKAVITRAKRAEAAFKIRLNDPIGAMATLRAERMYQFLDKLISIVLPRVRDFQGVSRTGFDGRGNYSLGLQEQIVFHEVDYDTIDSVRGLEITIVTNAGDDPKALRLLELLGMPWQK